jgi:hypothetical protein
MKRPASSFVDRIAMFIAAACGLHCICFPVLLAISAASSFVHVVSEPLEIALVTSAFILGIANLTFSWWKDHHKPECLILFLAGMALIAFRELLPGLLLPALISVAGGALVGGAHFRNMRLMRRCGCGPGSCSHGTRDR